MSRNTDHHKGRVTTHARDSRLSKGAQTIIYRLSEQRQLLFTRGSFEMSETFPKLDRTEWGKLLTIAGIFWALAPAPMMAIESRLVNFIYLFPIGLMLASLTVMGRSIAPGPISLIGYLVTGMGLIVAAVGTILEATFDVATLVQWGLAQGQVFYLGMFILLVGALFLGAGLWRETTFSIAGPALFLVLPVTVAGFWIFNLLGLGNLNWIPITLPYGLGWISLGYELTI